MIRRKAFRFRLKPTRVEAERLRRFVGCSRFVWNELLALNELRCERGEKRLGYRAMCDYLLYLKSEYTFLRDAHSQPLQIVVMDLEVAYRRAFDPKLEARIPRYKRKGRRRAFDFHNDSRLMGAASTFRKLAGSLSARVARSAALRRM
jgi:putative transposase